MLNTNKYIFQYPYYIGGYSVAEKISTRGRAVLSILCGAIWCVMLCFYEKAHYIYTSGTCMIGRDMVVQLGINVFRWLIGAVGSITVLHTVSLVGSCKNKITSAVAKLGKNTMGIYIISSSSNVFVLEKLTKNVGFHWLALILETVMMIVFTIAVSWALSRNRITRQAFLGGRG